MIHDIFIQLQFTEISLPASHEDAKIVKEREKSENQQTMHIGGFNFLQQNKTSSTTENVDVESGSAANGVLKEFNKNTSASENFKVNKKYKYGHVNKSFEPSSAYGM